MIWLTSSHYRKNGSLYNYFNLALNITEQNINNGKDKEDMYKDACPLFIYTHKITAVYFMYHR